MIRLATCFSGIGAIEHTLDRMGIDHKIIFACDNGEVDILTKKIHLDIDEIGEELKSLDNIIKEISFDDAVQDLYKNQLQNMLSQAESEYYEIVDKLTSAYDEGEDPEEKILRKILAMKEVKENRRNEYNEFLRSMARGSLQEQNLNSIIAALNVVNDFRKENSLESLKTSHEFNKSDGIQWDSVSELLQKISDNLDTWNGRHLIRQVQDLSQRVSQLHEKINYLKVQKKLESLGDDWQARKKYVDSLYEGLENKNRVKQSYLENYDVSENDFHWNIAFLDGHQYSGMVDLFVGGSPCQSFSLVGKQRGLEDTRGTLFYEYARLIDEIKPKVFIYENVKAVLSHDKGRTWKKMKEVFDELGYSFSDKVLNARNFGIPQNRERLFVVGFRKDLKLSCPFEFPNPVPLKTTMVDYLENNVSGKYFLPQKGVDFVTDEKNLAKKYTQVDGKVQLCQKKNQQFNWHGDFVFLSETAAAELKMEDYDKYLHSEEVTKYLSASGNTFFLRSSLKNSEMDVVSSEKGRIRKLTPRECLRLMGFNDSFKIVVPDMSMYQQSGNSIVVDVLINIMACIIRSLPDLGQDTNAKD